MPRAKKRGGGRRSATDLLEAGLEMLAKLSIDKLTIDALCGHLGVTKGSFYHHFKGRDDYLDRMLGHWASQGAQEKIDAVQGIEDPKKRFLAIVAEGETLPQGPEISIRAWAQRDPMARAHVQRLDAQRMDYLRGLFTEITGDPERAFTLSRIGYSLYVGTRMIVPPIAGADHARLLRMTAAELYGLDLPELD